MYEPQTVIEKMQAMAASLHEQLSENEVSHFDNFVNNTKLHFEDLKAHISGEHGMLAALQSFKAHVETFEKAIKEHNRTLAASTLDTIDYVIGKLKSNQPM